MTSRTELPGRAALPEAADLVRAAVLALPGVADLHTGAFGEVATYLPGRKVDGVRVRPDGAQVDVVLEWGAPVLATADDVRRVATSITGKPVDVVVQDIAAPPSAVPAHGQPT